MTTTTQPCSNIEWANEHGYTVEWARSMWVCLDDCDDCKVGFVDGAA